MTTQQVTEPQTTEPEGSETHGHLTLFIGDERRTSDAALGIALRGAGHNLRVHVIEFLKTGRERGEVAAVSLLTGVSLSQYGYVEAPHTVAEVPGAGIAPERLEAALREARVHVRQRVTNILILDGLLTVIDEGLVPDTVVTELVSMSAPWLDIVLTGQSAPDGLIEIADSVTAMQVIKDNSGGESVRRGIHY